MHQAFGRQLTLVSEEPTELRSPARSELSEILVTGCNH